MLLALAAATVWARPARAAEVPDVRARVRVASDLGQLEVIAKLGKTYCRSGRALCFALAAAAADICIQRDHLWVPLDVYSNGTSAIPPKGPYSARAWSVEWPDSRQAPCLRYQLPLQAKDAELYRESDLLFVNFPSWLPLTIEGGRVQSRISFEVRVETPSHWAAFVPGTAVDDPPLPAMPRAWRTALPDRPSLTVGRFCRTPLKAGRLRGYCLLRSARSVSPALIDAASKISMIFEEWLGPVSPALFYVIEGPSSTAFAGDGCIWLPPRFLDSRRSRWEPADIATFAHEWGHVRTRRRLAPDDDLARRAEGLCHYWAWRSLLRIGESAAAAWWRLDKRLALARRNERPQSDDDSSYSLGFFFWSGLEQLVGRRELDFALRRIFGESRREPATFASLIHELPEMSRRRALHHGMAERRCDESALLQTACGDVACPPGRLEVVARVSTGARAGMARIGIWTRTSEEARTWHRVEERSLLLSLSTPFTSGELWRGSFRLTAVAAGWAVGSETVQLQAGTRRVELVLHPVATVEACVFGMLPGGGCKWVAQFPLSAKGVRFSATWEAPEDAPADLRYVLVLNSRGPGKSVVHDPRAQRRCEGALPCGLERVHGSLKFEWRPDLIYPPWLDGGRELLEWDPLR